MKNEDQDWRQRVGPYPRLCQKRLTPRGVYLIIEIYRDVLVPIPDFLTGDLHTRCMESLSETAYERVRLALLRNKVELTIEDEKFVRKYVARHVGPRRRRRSARQAAIDTLNARGIPIPPFLEIYLRRPRRKVPETPY